MKKTLSVNIKGINFNIEVDAYEKLEDYLDRLNRTLKNQEGAQEIIEDVELRIAEVCSSILTDNKTVIELVDINQILKNLGNPEDYLDDEAEQNNNYNNYSNQSSENNTEKRLFRDTENAALAGVCLGISNYLNIDVVIIRAIFIVFFLFAGFGFPLYIILWIIVPPTKNTIDRLRMKGRPITVETVREEVENAASQLSKSSKNFVNKIRQDETYTKSISKGSRILSTLLGLGFIGFGMILLILFIIFGVAEMQMIPIQGEIGFLSLPEFGELVLLDNGDYKTFWYGSMISLFSTVLFLLLIGSLFLFRFKNTFAKIALLLLFLIGTGGFISSLTVGLRTGRDFVITGEIEHEIGTVFSNQLIIIPEQENLEIDEDFTIKSNGKNSLMSVKGDEISFYGISILYKRSKDSLFHIKQNFKAHSQSHKIALEKSKNIHQNVTLESDTLTLSTEYSFPKEDKIRGQRVKIIIEIPENGTVKIGGEDINLFFSDDNEGDYYDTEHGKLRYNGNYSHWD